MIDLVLAVVVAALAWLSARLTVVAAINASDDAEGMIRFMLRETYVGAVFVLGMWLFTSWGTGVILFMVPRMLFLIFTNWHALYTHFDDLKKIVS